MSTILVIITIQNISYEEAAPLLKQVIENDRGGAEPEFRHKIAEDSAESVMAGGRGAIAVEDVSLLPTTSIKDIKQKFSL